MWKFGVQLREKEIKVKDLIKMLALMAFLGAACSDDSEIKIKDGGGSIDKTTTNPLAFYKCMDKNCYKEILKCNATVCQNMVFCIAKCMSDGKGNGSTCGTSCNHVYPGYTEYSSLCDCGSKHCKTYKTTGEDYARLLALY